MTISLSNLLGAGPAFSAYQGTNQSVSNTTATLVNIDTVIFDTNSNFNTSTKSFQPTVSGYYNISATISSTFVSGDGGANIIYLYKNGSKYLTGSALAFSPDVMAAITCHASSLIYMNGTTDYVQVYALFYSTAPDNLIVSGASNSVFCGYLARQQ